MSGGSTSSTASFQLQGLFPSETPRSDSPPQPNEESVDLSAPQPAAPLVPIPSFAAAGHVLPFQVRIPVGTADKTLCVFTSWEPIADAYIQRLTSIYRYASLRLLEAAVFPKAESVTSPVTVAMAWVPNQFAVAQNEVVTVYGSTQFVIGAAMAASLRHCLPADLTKLTPVLKDRVLHQFTPKLILGCESLKSQPSSCLTVVVRGLLAVSAPTITAMPPAL